MSPGKIQLVGAAVMMAILAAICLLPPGQAPTGRRQTLIDAIDRGVLGASTSSQLRAMEAVLPDIARLADLPKLPAVDRLLLSRREGGPAFIVVATAEGRELTACGRANAMYDFSIDAIFVDAALLEPELLRTTIGRASTDRSGADVDPAARTYLTFTLLHELAHRQLGHGTLSREDAAERSSELEGQADAWALKRFSASGLGFDPATDASSRGTFQYDGPPLPPGPEATAVRLADAAAAVTQGLLFADAPYSPTSASDTHPTFAFRMRRAIATARANVSPNSLASGYVGQVERLLDRVMTGGERLVLEASSPVPIKSVRFTTDGSVWFISAGRVAKVNVAGFSSSPPIVLSLKTNDFVPHPAGDLAWNEELLPSGGRAVMLSGRVVDISRGALPSDARAATETDSSTIFPSLARDRALVLLQTGRYREIRRAGPVASALSLEQAGQELAASLGVDKALVTLRSGWDWWWLDIETLTPFNNWRHAGVAMLDADTLRLDGPHEHASPPSVGRLAPRLVFRDGADLHCYAVEVVESGDGAGQLRAWSLQGRDGPTIADAIPLAISGGGTASTLSHPRLVLPTPTDDGFLLSVTQDDVFHLHGLTGQLSHVLGPAGTYLRAGPGGLVAAWSPDGHRVRIYRTSPSERP